MSSNLVTYNLSASSKSYSVVEKEYASIKTPFGLLECDDLDNVDTFVASVVVVDNNGGQLIGDSLLKATIENLVSGLKDDFLALPSDQDVKYRVDEVDSILTNIDALMDSYRILTARVIPNNTNFESKVQKTLDLLKAKSEELEASSYYVERYAQKLLREARALRLLGSKGLKHGPKEASALRMDAQLKNFLATLLKDLSPLRFIDVVFQEDMGSSAKWYLPVSNLTLFNEVFDSYVRYLASTTEW